MSRATVATPALTSTTEPWYLVARPNTASLIVSSDDYPVSAPSVFDYHADNLSCVLNASLHADLKTVQRIVEKMDPDKLDRLLSAEHGTGKAITCLGRIRVERTGTPLQMAIYDHDEEMVAFFEKNMYPAEFQRQWEAVVGKNYKAFLDKQEADAKRLCAGLQDAFQSAPPNVRIAQPFT